MDILKRRLALLFAAVLIATGFSMTANAQQMRVGFVNVAILMDRAPQAKVAMEQLEAEFAPRQREVVAKQKELTDLAERIQRDAPVMGETERKNAENDYRNMQRDVKRLQEEFAEDLNLRRNEELGNLQRVLLQEVQNYAQTAGYDLVVGEGVLFASSAVNITENVIRAMEANFQAQGNNSTAD